MASLNAKWTSVLARLSKEVPENVYTKLRPVNDITAKDSPLWLTFLRFRQQGEQAAFEPSPEGWQGSKDQLHLSTIHHLIRLRRNVESWGGQLLHDLIGEIHWGIVNGAGDDLLDFISQAKTIAAHDTSIGTKLTLLRLERMVVTTYAESGQDRVDRLNTILKERSDLLDKYRDVLAGEGELDRKWDGKWDGKPHRVKSDLLFRLSKTLEDAEYDLLREYMRLYTKNGKQFRLLEYYRGLAVWSKQREQADWQGEKLAQLKNRTLLWLMRRMGILGKWQGAEVHGYIGDIRWCLSQGIDAEGLGFFSMAEEKAMEEGYESLLTLQELKAVTGDYLASKTNTKEDGKIAIIADKLKEIEEIHGLRVRHFEKIKVKTVQSGVNHLEGWKRLDAELHNIAPDGIKTGEGLREFYVLKMMAEHSLARNVDAVHSASNLCKVHQDHPHLSRSNWKRYFKEQRAIVFIYALGGELDRAHRAIEEMRSLADKSPNLLIQSITTLLLSIDHLYSVSGDLGLAMNAIEAYRNNKHLLRYCGEGHNWVWLHFFVSKAALHLALYKNAIEALYSIIDQKKQSNLHILGHSRVMLLIANLGLETEIDYVYHAANACSMFLHRHKNLPKILGVAVQAIKRIATYNYGTDLQYSAIEDAIGILGKYSARGQDSNIKEISFQYAGALEILLAGFKDRQQLK